MTKHYGHETRTPPELKMDFWLIVSRGGKGAYGDRGHPGVRVTADYPKMSANERAINLKLKLPIALFESPSLVAKIEVAAPDQPVSIDLSAVAEAVRGVIGAEVRVEVATPDDA